MSTLPITYAHDETMKMLQDRANAEPAAADQFFLKVYRRRQQHMRGSEHIATFNGASVLHFAQPEAWLPTLFGGGDYEIFAYDPGDASKKIGGLIVVSYPTDSNPMKLKFDFRAMDGASWRGPRGLVFPDRETSLPQTTTAAPQRTPAIGESQQAQTQQGNGAAAVVPDWVIREREAASEARRQLELQLERERAERKAEAEAAKLRAEMERDRAQAERRTAELEAKVTAAATAAATAKPQVDISSTVVALLTAATPILAKIFDSQRESREAEAKRAEAQAQANQLLLTKIAEPRGMPPEVSMLFEVMKGQASASGEMMSRMVEATQAFNGMAVTMIQTMAENLGGEQGNPILDGAKDIIKTVVAMQKGTEVAGRRQAQQMVQTAQALPAQQQAPQQPLPASQPQFPTQQHMPQQTHHAAARAVGPQTPTPSGFAGLPPVGPADTVAAIEGMIRNHDEPAAVVSFIIEKINHKDQQLFAALDQHNGDVESLIGDRLGGWALLGPNNQYLDKLADAWREQASAAGIMEEEGDEGGVDTADAP